MRTLFDYDLARSLIEEAVGFYRLSAPQVADWADALYLRLDEAERSVTLAEILTVERLQSERGWVHPSLAANLVYKLRAELGQPNSGNASY